MQRLSSKESIREANLEYARQVCDFLPTASYVQALKVYDEVTGDKNLDSVVIAEMGLCDRFFLLTMILNRGDAYHPWLYERCREVEASPDGHIDLWAREHYKSTIITFAGTIQEFAKEPPMTIGIFSHTRPIAKAFLQQIKQECERNAMLPVLYPDSFWVNPEKQAKPWSLDGGLRMKGWTPSNTMSIEAHGMVDGQPTSKHFKLMIYDDVVTRESVSTPEMIQKTTEGWELSRNLSAINEDGKRRTWYIGTRYNFADSYQTMLDRKVAVPRIYPATDDGSVDGNPVFFSVDDWEERKRETKGATLAAQMLQNPLAGEEQKFKPEWIRRYEVRPQTLNVYIMCDPAGNEKKDDNCNTAIGVVGVDAQLNKYLLDGVCHKISLPERWALLKKLRRKWLQAPGVQIVQVGYERYGMQSDIAHFEEMMKIENYFFDIKELSWPREGSGAKNARIGRLEPDLKNWRFFFPYDGEQTKLQTKAIESGKGHLVSKPIKVLNHHGQPYDLVKWFLTNEYVFYPATTLKDFLDMLSRIYDMEIVAPTLYDDADLIPEYEGDY